MLTTGSRRHADHVTNAPKFTRATLIKLRNSSKVLILDNMKPIVAKADSVNPQFTVGWLEYAQARGFITDPTRVASPQDKPRVAYCTPLR